MNPPKVHVLKVKSLYGSVEVVGPLSCGAQCKVIRSQGTMLEGINAVLME
jgi:hypothetical protein